jgi:hypothetical protein
MDQPPVQGCIQRALAIAVVAALAVASPAFASDPPNRDATAERGKAESRYCIHRHKAGAARMEKYCKTRKQWIRQDGVDPARHVK